MKKLLLFPLLCMSIVFVSCEDDEPEASITPSPNPTPTAPSESNAFWKIELKTEEQQDLTAQFQDYYFQFANNGVFHVLDNNYAAVDNGTWLIFQDDGLTELRISGLTVPALFELNDDWYKQQMTDSLKWFQDGDHQIKFIIP